MASEPKNRIFKRLDLGAGRTSDWWTILAPGGPAALIWSSSAGGGMTLLAIATEWANALGPLGVGGVGLASALLTWVGISAGQLLRAKVRLRHSQLIATDKWQQEVDSINPLASEFHTKRISLSEIASPIHNKIVNKRFIDCELLGPRVIIIVGKSTVTGAGFVECDFICVKENIWIRNATVLEDVTVIGGIFWSCTILLTVDMVKLMKMQLPLLSLSGDPEIDAWPTSNSGMSLD